MEVPSINPKASVPNTESRPAGLGTGKSRGALAEKSWRNRGLAAKRGRKPVGNRKIQTLWSRLGSPRQRARQVVLAARNGKRTLLGLATIGAAVALMWTGFRFLTHSSYFAISTIEVSGNVRMSDEEIVARLPFTSGSNIFTTSMSETAAALERLPWVKQAIAARRFPNRVELAIEERVAAAIVELDDQHAVRRDVRQGELGGFAAEEGPGKVRFDRYLVDQSGVAFVRATDDDSANPGLPLIIGASRDSLSKDPAAVAARFRQAIEVAQTWKSNPSRPLISTIDIADDSFALRSDNLTIHLGAFSSMAGSLDAFDAAWAALSNKEQQSLSSMRLDQLHDTVTIAFAAPVED
jgi:POTRA domain, FtsQ-type/Cell division protein FtsQ